MRTTPRFARFPARFLPNRSSSKSSARRSLTQTRGGHLARSRRVESYAKSEACESTPARIRTMRRTKDTIESSRRHDCSSDAPQSRSNLRTHFFVLREDRMSKIGRVRAGVLAIVTGLGLTAGAEAKPALSSNLEIERSVIVRGST